MKRIVFQTTLMSAIAAVCFSLNAAGTVNAHNLSALKKELRSAPAPEMAAKAAQIVAQTDATMLDTTAASVMKAAVDVRPAAMISVVSAIAKQTPSAAPVAAATAATLQPKQAGQIARAATAAAPDQAGKIVYAVCKAVPSQYAFIATGAAQAAPDATKEILQQVVAALPGLKAFVEKASTGVTDASVGQIMAATESLVDTAAKSSRTSSDRIASGDSVVTIAPPPTPGPPFTPFSPPTTTTRTNTVEIPGGGDRVDYSGG